MIGLFQGMDEAMVLGNNFDLFLENGPCQVNSDGKTTYLNPYR